MADADAYRKLEFLFGDASFFVGVTDVRVNLTGGVRFSFTGDQAKLSWQLRLSEELELTLVHRTEIPTTDSHYVTVKDCEDPPQHLAAHDGRIKLVGAPHNQLWWDERDRKVINDAFFTVNTSFMNDASDLLYNASVHVLGDDIDKPVWTGYKYIEFGHSRYSKLIVYREWLFPRGTVLEFEIPVPLHLIARSVWIDREIGLRLEALGMPHAAGVIVYNSILDRLPDCDLLDESEYARCMKHGA